MVASSEILGESVAIAQEPLQYCYHCRVGPKQPVTHIFHSNLVPVIGMLVGIQPPGSSDMTQYYIIAELPIRGISDGCTHTLCTLAPKHLPHD